MIYRNWKWCIKNGVNPFLGLDYYIHRIQSWLHWNFGLHFFKPLGTIGVLAYEKSSGKYVWCQFCGSKFEAHDYLWEKVYKNWK